MAVYNGAAYVCRAIESVLGQTFADFELVLVEDGSTDETPWLLRQYDDRRIVLVENDRNVGLTKSLNRGIDASHGEFIARQDADDFSFPNRLACQVAFLDSHPTVGLVGSAALWVDAREHVLREWYPPTDPAVIQQMLLFAIPFRHGTFMFRRTCLQELDGGYYNEAFPVAQDCDLLLRVSEHWDVTNVPEMLYAYRWHQQTITASRETAQFQYLHAAQQQAIARRLLYGWRRLSPRRKGLPKWVVNASRRWMAQRYAWWSAGARQASRNVAFQFLLVALLLDPTTPEIWSYVTGILARKTGLAKLRTASRDQQPSGQSELLSK